MNEPHPKPDSDRPRWEDVREIRIEADPDRVWKAWGDPAHIARWFADDARGRAEAGESLVHVFESMGMEMSYRVVEAEPGEKLVLEGQSPLGPFFQEIRLRRDGNATVMKLIHWGFGDDADFKEEYEGMDSGWKLALPILRHYLERYYGRDKRTDLVLRPATFTFDRVAGLFREGPGPASWLLSDGNFGDTGDRFALRTREGRPFSGEVLAWSGRELAVSWDEIEGTLELKAVGGGPWPYMVGLRSMTWSDRPPEVDGFQQELGAAVDRLVQQLG